MGVARRLVFHAGGVGARDVSKLLSACGPLAGDGRPAREVEPEDLSRAAEKPAAKWTLGEAAGYAWSTRRRIASHRDRDRALEMTSTQPGPAARTLRRPATDARLVQAVRDTAIRGHVTTVIAQTLTALGDLSRLDESLYVRFMEGGGNVVDEAAPRALLGRLAGVTFRGVRSLLAYLPRVGLPGDDESRPDSSAPPSSDFDFDVEDMTGSPEEDEAPNSLDLSELDIDGALGAISEGTIQVDEATKWTECREKLGTVDYGLRSQLRDFDRRFDEAIEARMVAQALEALDDTRASIGEGLFAIVVAIYQTFAPQVDPSTVAPGYLSALESALLVRRGVADLSRGIDRDNAKLQDGTAPAAEQQVCYDRIRQTLESFLATSVFRAMRPADRWELTKFHRTLGQESMIEGKLTCEGLAKYLESLSAVNQRDVLLTHDARTIAELHELLSNARALITVNLGMSADMVRQAMALGDELYGRSAANDELLRAVKDAQPALSTEGEVEATLSTLELLFDEGA
jgi:hypothetical protein